MTYEKLKTNWNNRTWREHLSTVYGVYLITDTKTGKLYEALLMGTMECMGVGQLI